MRIVSTEAANIRAVTEIAECLGWTRLWSAPNVVVVPGYHDALAETNEMAAAEDRQRAEERRQAAAEIRELLEHGE